MGLVNRLRIPRNLQKQYKITKNNIQNIDKTAPVRSITGDEIINL